MARAASAQVHAGGAGAGRSSVSASATWAGMREARRPLEAAHRIVSQSWSDPERRKALIDLELRLDNVAEGQTDEVIVLSDLRVPRLAGLLAELAGK